MDQLSPFLDRFSLSVRVFYSGRLCGTSGDHQSEHAGHLHLLRQGTLRITQADGRVMEVDQPSVLFYPRPYRHRLQANAGSAAEIVCASIEFGAGVLNPLVASLPELLVIPLASLEGLTPTVELLFAEAFLERPGRQAAVDRLAEYFFILLLRSVMQTRMVAGGVLMGLAEPRLARAIAAMHERPEHPWSLEELAHLAGMSRARFAVHFRRVVGATPFDYLTDWRVGAAQIMLRKGETLKMVAPCVGYASTTALTRAFSRRLGLSPSEWLLAGGF